MATFLAIPTAIAFTPFTKSVFVFASAAQLFAMSSSSYPYASRSNLNRLRQHGCGKNRNRYGSGDGQHTNVPRSPPLTPRSACPKRMTSSGTGVASHTFRSKLVDEEPIPAEAMAVRHEIERQERAFVARLRDAILAGAETPPGCWDTFGVPEPENPPPGGRSLWGTQAQRAD